VKDPSRRHRKPLLDRIGIRVLLGAILPGAILGLWALASAGRGGLLPTPGEVADVLVHPFRDPPNLDSRPLIHSAGISLIRVLLGFSAAALTAVPLGLLAGSSKGFLRVLSPLVELFRPICPIAWMPLAILFFGFSSIGSAIWGETAWRHDLLSQLQLAMIFIIWWGGFFPIFLNTVAGVGAVRDLHLEAARMLGAGRLHIFTKVVLPASLPSILTGLRIGMGLAWMVIIAAEIFPGTRSGLGYMILTAHQVAQYEYAFASILVIGAIGLAINAGMLFASNRIGRWESLER
jgi:NitT/TauT family transport system permease protein